LKDRRASLAEAFAADPAQAREVMESRYQQERATRPPAEIHAVFERQRKGVETKLQNLLTDLVRLKTSFAGDYGFSGDSQPGATVDHERERDAWRDSKLPEYEEAIGRARAEAIEQLAE